MCTEYRVSIGWRSGFDATFTDLETALRAWSAMTGGRVGDHVSVRTRDASGEVTRDVDLIHVTELNGGVPFVYVNPSICRLDSINSLGDTDEHGD